ncbi:hypothetical protein KRMM14A1259_18140 [Krasilnikovia sp. MM14-A1259]
MSRENSRPDPLRDRFADMSRRDLLWMWLLYSVLLSPALVALYTAGQWLRPGVGPNWSDGLVQGVLGPPVCLAVLRLLGRWIRRRRRTRRG